MASPQDIIDSNGTAWTFWDLTSTAFGLGNNSSLDYPDIGFGDTFLYISVNVLGFRETLMVVRIPLSELENGETIHFQFTNPNRTKIPIYSHIMQNNGNEVFWAVNRSSSRIQIFSWRENSTRWTWRSVGIGSWPNQDFSEIAPDTTNWLGPTFGGAILGAARRISREGTDELFFAWTAGRSRNFPHPHIQGVRLDSSNFRVLDQFQIWNPNFAFAIPGLATNSNNEVAASLAVGGPTLFPTHAVGIVEDGQYFGSTISDGALTRYGDYYTVRPHFPNSTLFSAFGYGVRLLDPTKSTSCNVPPFCGFDQRFVLFGRASDVLADLVPVRVDQTFCNIVIAPPGLSLVVTVKNQGSSVASASNTTVAFSSGEVFSLPTGFLAPGQSVDLPALSIPLGCFQPDCSFRITVDSSDQVNEFDEANNSVQGQCVG